MLDATLRDRASGLLTASRRSDVPPFMVMDVMAAAEHSRRAGRRTIIFVDEVHRFNKAQQDAFLPHVERGTVTLVGATTENPSFELNKQTTLNAERYGFDFALSMIKLRGFGGKTEFWEYNLESFTLMAGLAAVIVAGFVVYAHDPARVERDFVRSVADLPHDGRSFVLLGYEILAVWALALLAIGAIFVRRWRLARDLVVAAVASWAVGRALAFLAHDASLWQSIRNTFDLTDAPRFPTVRLAVAVAMVVVVKAFAAMVSAATALPLTRPGSSSTVVCTVVPPMAMPGRGAQRDPVPACR